MSEYLKPGLYFHVPGNSYWRIYEDHHEATTDKEFKWFNRYEGKHSIGANNNFILLESFTTISTKSRFQLILDKI